MADQIHNGFVMRITEPSGNVRYGSQRNGGILYDSIGGLKNSIRRQWQVHDCLVEAVPAMVVADGPPIKLRG